MHLALLTVLVETGSLPCEDELADRTGILQNEIETHLDTLVLADYIGRDETGQVVCLYPFSPRPSLHVVRFNQVSRYAMCSIDALGVAAMYGSSVTVQSVCSSCGCELCLTIKPGRIVSASREDITVVVRAYRDGPACETCCPGTVFACCPAHAIEVARHSEDSKVVPLSQALRHAEEIFRNLLSASLPRYRPRGSLTRRTAEP
jgi:hypothetical protein